MTPVNTVRGQGPIVLGFPHTGTYVPEGVVQALNTNGRKLADTDWHVDRLYEGLLADVTTVTATFHRYVIDANRDPGGASLYPGQNTTGLVPMTDFDGLEIWDLPPSAAEIARRLTAFHAPYHDALRVELDRVRGIHGIAILYDCHSIRSDIPFLFDGTLPDFNVGTNSGETCAASIEAATVQVCERAPGYSNAVNGRFKGGWTTRHYGHPPTGVHAIQMELAQSAYLTNEASPWAYDAAKAKRLRPHLKDILTRLAGLATMLGDIS